MTTRAEALELILERAALLGPHPGQKARRVALRGLVEGDAGLRFEVLARLHYDALIPLAWEAGLAQGKRRSPYGKTEQQLRAMLAADLDRLAEEETAAP